MDLVPSSRTWLQQQLLGVALGCLGLMGLRGLGFRFGIHPSRGLSRSLQSSTALSAKALNPEALNPNSQSPKASPKPKSYLTAAQ